MQFYKHCEDKNNVVAQRLDLAAQRNRLVVPALRETRETTFFTKKPYSTHLCIAWGQFITVRRFPSRTHKCTSKGMCRLATSKACQTVFGKFPKTQPNSRKHEHQLIIHHIVYMFTQLN